MTAEFLAMLWKWSLENPVDAEYYVDKALNPGIDD